MHQRIDCFQGHSNPVANAADLKHCIAFRWSHLGNSGECDLGQNKQVKPFKTLLKCFNSNSTKRSRQLDDVLTGVHEAAGVGCALHQKSREPNCRPHLYGLYLCTGQAIH